MERIPLFDATAPVACTIGADEVDDRIATLERLRDATASVERYEHGFVLRFADDVEADLRQFVVDETRCCQFWGFEVLTEPGPALRWEGPPAASPALDVFAAFFRREAPIGDLAGLL